MTTMRRAAATVCALAAMAAARREAAAAITVYPRVGSQTDSVVTPRGPGIIVMGGGSDVDGAFVWAHDTVMGGSASGADVVVLRATGDNAYDSYIYGLAAFNSVQTLLIPTPASASDLSTAAGIVDKAEVVFFAGGNQADYVGWKGSPLMMSVAQLHQRGGVVGGTSAGAAILGQLVFDAVAAGSATVASADAVANPYEASISFTRGLLPFAVLDDAITDPHFVVRDRFGRLTAFMARQLADGVATAPVHGIGVDEGSAIVIDKGGIGTLKQFTAGTGSAFVVTGGAPTTIQSGKALVYPALTVTRLDADGQTYDFAHWCGSTTTYTVTVDGTANPIYNPASPYTATGTAGTCQTTGSPDLGGGAGSPDLGGGAGGVDLGDSDGGTGAGAVADDMGLAGGTTLHGSGCECRLGAAGPPSWTLVAVLALGLTLALRAQRRRG